MCRVAWRARPKTTGGKRITDGPFLPRESAEAYKILYAKLPKPSGIVDADESRLYEQYGSVTDADPRDAEIDLVAKWVGGEDDDDSRKFQLPTERGTGHEPRWFSAF